jgi:hypothetical protein
VVVGNERIEGLLNQVGNVLAKDKHYPLDGTFLWAEAASRTVSVSIFKDLGDHLVYRWPTREIDDVIMELWEAAPEDKRWAAIQYRVVGDTFTASFTYPEEMGPAGGALDRRERILAQRYGNKRVDYPPL